MHCHGVGGGLGGGGRVQCTASSTEMRRQGRGLGCGGWHTVEVKVAGSGVQPRLWLWWEGCWSRASYCRRVLQSAIESLLLNKISLLKPAAPNKHQASHTANSLARLETFQVRVHHGPTLLPSPGVTWLPNFSGNDPVGVHSLSM